MRFILTIIISLIRAFSRYWSAHCLFQALDMSVGTGNEKTEGAGNPSRSQLIEGAFHWTKNSEISGLKLNGTITLLYSRKNVQKILHF